MSTTNITSMPPRPSEDTGDGRQRTLGKLVEHSQLMSSLGKRDLQCGDRVVVRTRNSVYSLVFLEGDDYYVSGGWFDKKGLSPLRTTVNGCTWGGCAIKMDIVAAPGLFLEFGNRVTTTRIKDFQVLRLDENQTRH
jgi:hypothetical protein